LLDLERRDKRHDFDVAMEIPSFKALMDKIEEEIPESPIWMAPSYYRVERRLKAHPLHFDGCKLDGSPTATISLLALSLSSQNCSATFSKSSRSRPST
jgi:hypothetical protein